ncbi:MAG: TRAP transporter large permease [Clostridiales Family XIII bacterium]|nr:TRAP transporter large permease [Clostridiales Family XIII bacterium]
MDPTVIGIIITIAFCVLLFTGLNVSLCMILCGTVGCMLLLRNPLTAITFVADDVFATFTAYMTSVAPMFMLMGDIAAESGLGRDLFDTISKLSGGKRGVLASACQVVCAVFGAICGSGSATASMMSRVAYPEMKRYGYSDELSTASIGSGASLATLIPPSLPLITYGLISMQSIGKLFMAGILTGILLMVLFIITIQIWALVSPKSAPAAAKSTRKEKLQALKNGSLIKIMALFLVAMGGLFLGWFTPTEAGVVGVFGMVILTLVSRTFSFKMLMRAINNTLVMSVVIYMLLAGSEVFNKFFSLTRIPITLGNIVENLDMSPFMVIVIITLIYFLLGTAIEVLPIMLLTTPIFLPVITEIGYDPIWFGVYMIVIMGLGAISPPVGMSVFVTSVVCDVPISKVFKGSMPFMVTYIVCALIIALFPDIVSFLPNAMR